MPSSPSRYPASPTNHLLCSPTSAGTFDHRSTQAAPRSEVLREVETPLAQRDQLFRYAFSTQNNMPEAARQRLDDELYLRQTLYKKAALSLEGDAMRSNSWNTASPSERLRLSNLLRSLRFDEISEHQQGGNNATSQLSEPFMRQEQQS